MATFDAASAAPLAKEIIDLTGESDGEAPTKVKQEVDRPGAERDAPAEVKRKLDQPGRKPDAPTASRPKRRAKSEGSTAPPLARAQLAQIPFVDLSTPSPPPVRHTNPPSATAAAPSPPSVQHAEQPIVDLTDSPPRSPPQQSSYPRTRETVRRRRRSPAPSPTGADSTPPPRKRARNAQADPAVPAEDSSSSFKPINKIQLDSTGASSLTRRPRSNTGPAQWAQIFAAGGKLTEKQRKAAEKHLERCQHRVRGGRVTKPGAQEHVQPRTEGTFRYTLDDIFKGEIIKKTQAESLVDSGIAYHNAIDSPFRGHLRMWSDASVRNGQDPPMGGIGVAYKTLDEEDKWADGMYVARGDGGTFAYEMGGIMSALRIAADLANETPGSFSAVTIFTDSAGSLVAIEKGAPGGIVSRNWMRDRAIEQAARLVKMGVRIQLRWVKAHAGDPGNERVDQLAGATARYAALAFGKLAQACADGEVEILPSK